MQSQRWLTALILLPLLVLVLLKGGLLLFVLVILVVSGLGQWEFLGMFLAEADKSRRVKAILLGSLLLLSFCTAHPSDNLCTPSGILFCNPSTVLFVLVWCLFFLFLFYLLSYGHIEHLSRDLAVSLLGLLYLPFLLGHLIWLRFLASGGVVGPLVPAGDLCRGYRGLLYGPDAGENEALSGGEPGEDLGRRLGRPGRQPGGGGAVGEMVPGDWGSWPSLPWP